MHMSMSQDFPVLLVCTRLLTPTAKGWAEGENDGPPCSMHLVLHAPSLHLHTCLGCAGVEDLICNWLGNKRWVDVLPWTGVHGWKNAPEKAWAVDSKTVGSVRSYGGLSFVKVRSLAVLSLLLNLLLIVA